MVKRHKFVLKYFLMKHILFLLCLLLSISVFSQVKVNGYYRKNGTYVAPHYRSSPDGNPYNNYSYPGNVNPYTGKIATGNPDTYLNRYNNRKRKNIEYPGSGSYYYGDGNSNFKLDLGFQATTFSYSGGYLILGVKDISFGFEAGGGNKKYYIINYQGLNYDGYWAGLIGYKGFYIGAGANIFSQEYPYVNYNDILYTTGFHNNRRHLSYKIGMNYSEQFKFGGSLGLGVKIYK
jgi:hypothetical protein